MKKERLDILIFNRNLASSRSLAQSYIMSGVVYVDGILADKPGAKTSEGSKIEIKKKMIL